MGGGLLQLVAYGVQDIYLSGNPQMTFFKSIYRRHTNFSIESIGQDFTGPDEFNTNLNIDLARKGDLIHNMWLQVKLPPATEVISCDNSSNPDIYRNWVNNVGHALIESASVLIGGQVIDTHISEWFDIWNELTDPHKNHWKLIGKKEQYSIHNQDKVTRYYIPLIFWFNKYMGQALLLIALQYHMVSIKIKTRDLKSLIVCNGSNISLSGKIKELKLFTDYIFLDTDERKRFALSSHEYLIEQLQYTNEKLKSGKNLFNFKFNHPVKELVWVLKNQSRNQTTNTPIFNSALNDTNGNDWFNYSSNIENTELEYGTYDIFNHANMLINGKERFEERDALYFRQVQPLQHHSNLPKKHIYVYSFALKPEQHQPSGTCNFSRINKSTLKIDTIIDSDLYLFGINYNVLRIMSGMGGLAYTN